MPCSGLLNCPYSALNTTQRKYVNYWEDRKKTNLFDEGIWPDILWYHIIYWLLRKTFLCQLIGHWFWQVLLKIVRQIYPIIYMQNALENFLGSFQCKWCTVSVRLKQMFTKNVLLSSTWVNIISDYYRPQRSWAKVIFSRACVKNSVQRGEGVWLSACWDTNPPPLPPPEQTQPPPIPLGADPQSRHPPRADTPGADIPPGADPPGSRHPPTPWSWHPLPWELTPPGKQTAAYGQRAAGTYPTGMHSCFMDETPCVHHVSLSITQTTVAWSSWKWPIFFGMDQSSRKWMELYNLFILEQATN